MPFAPALRSTSLAALLLGSLCAVSGCTQQAAQSKKHGVEFLHAPESGAVAPIVLGEQQRAKKDGSEVLVYVGATWCEPCQRFHRAAQAGKLDAAFPGLRLIEFDADRDNERLASAGYTSHYIPLFARPQPDGRSSGRQIEGSIKGEGAVEEIAPRLRSLLVD